MAQVYGNYSFAHIKNQEDLRSIINTICGSYHKGNDPFFEKASESLMSAVFNYLLSECKAEAQDIVGAIKILKSGYVGSFADNTLTTYDRTRLAVRMSRENRGDEVHYEAKVDDQKNLVLERHMIRRGESFGETSTMDMLFSELEKKNPEHIACQNFRVYKCVADCDKGLIGQMLINECILQLEDCLNKPNRVLGSLEKAESACIQNANK